MKIDTAKWQDLRAAVAADDVELFKRLVVEHCRLELARQRRHERVCDQVRSRERGLVPFFAFDR